MAPNRSGYFGILGTVIQGLLNTFSSVLFSVFCPEDFEKGTDKLHP